MVHLDESFVVRIDELVEDTLDLSEVATNEQINIQVNEITHKLDNTKDGK